LVQLSDQLEEVPGYWPSCSGVAEPSGLLDILGFQGNGAFGAHRRFARLLTGERMLGIALRAEKNVLAFFAAKAALSTYFRGMWFVSHLASSLMIFSLKVSYYYSPDKGLNSE
jgi:hypothetical protein